MKKVEGKDKIQFNTTPKQYRNSNMYKVIQLSKYFFYFKTFFLLKVNQVKTKTGTVQPAVFKKNN